jgi:nicotinamide-nucleotide amidase
MADPDSDEDENDDEDVEALARALDGRSLASAESLTGGMLSQRIARTEGSSDWYRGGLVAYQREIKFELLEVTPGPVVTERAAREMASGAAKLFQADATVSVTGAAGPAPHDGAPPGTVVVGTSVDGAATAFTLHFEGSPEEVCEQATVHAIAALRNALRNASAPPPDRQR